MHIFLVILNKDYPVEENTINVKWLIKHPNTIELYINII